MRLPTTNPITLPFGATTAPYSPTNPHKGTDFSYLPDSTIYAPVGGTVILHANNGNDGNGVYMNYPPYFIGMLHTSKYLVNNGDTVMVGQPLAIMGETGLAYGVHLHFAVKLNGVFIDPMSVIQEEPMINQGDMVNVWQAIYGHDPTQADLDAWLGKDFKSLVYEKCIPEFESLRVPETVLAQGRYVVQ